MYLATAWARSSSMTYFNSYRPLCPTHSPCLPCSGSVNLRFSPVVLAISIIIAGHAYVYDCDGCTNPSFMLQSR